MAIDTNIGLVYNEHYPISGVDQSSQGFRDNFSVLKRVIENLQSATHSATSAFSIASTVGSGGVVRITVGFRDNTFRLPSGNPLVTPEAGMIRHVSGVPQFHDGSAWRTGVVTDAQGGVRIPSTSYLKLPAGFSDQRPATAEDGMIRFNASLGVVECFTLGEWREVGSGANTDLNSAGGTISGTLNLLTDATLPDHAVNFRTLKTFATGIFQAKNKGISASFNQVSNAALLTAQPFTLTLDGDVTGNVVITDLGDATMTTTIPQKLTLKDVRDEVGTFVKGTVRVPNANATTETGITVNYDSTNNTLELGVREFDINLTGAVTGTGHSSKLGNVTIVTTTDRIRGLTLYDEDVVLGAQQSVQEIKFIGAGITATQSGNVAEITVPAGISLADVRDEVGSFVKGTVRTQTNTTTETGIIVNYDAVNNTLELGVREFDISLTGAITGTGHSSKLGDVIIETTTDRIKGIDASNDGVALTAEPQSVTRLDFTGGGINATQSGNVVTVDVPNGLSLQDVRDHVGSFITGTVRDPSSLGSFTESGIFVFYDVENNKLELVPRDFSVTLTGAVTGTTTISRLGNAIIDTTTDRIRGIRVFDEGGALGAPQSIQNLNFIGNAISVLQSGDTATITINDGLTNQDIRDTVGSLVKGTSRISNSTTTETGVIVNYDTENNTLELGVKDFSIGLSGAVTGSAVISKLGNVVINTTTDSIRGIQIKDEGVPTGLSESARVINFVGGGISAEQLGDEVTIEVLAGLTNLDIRDTVGSLVKGTIRDPSTQEVSESGIIVHYDSLNNTLEIGAQDFTIGLVGAVTGTTTISRLGNAVMTTTTDLVKGLRFYNEGSPLGLPESVREVNFVGNAITVSQLGTTATVSLADSLTLAEVRDEMGRVIVGQNGIDVVYDHANQTMRVSPRSFAVELTGAVSGTGTVTNLGNVSITTTTTDLIRGLTILDEGVPGTAQAIKSLNFTGTGIAVTQNGAVATVNVPTGLTASDVRNTVGGFVSGTVTTGNATTESGITVNYDSTNNRLELGAREFDINLEGAVTGTATVRRLDDVTITTTTSLVKGMRFYDEGSALGLPQSVQEVNFVGNAVAVTQTGNTATVTVTQGINLANVREQIASMVGGTNGLTSTYNADNQSLTIKPNNFAITLTGAVSGTGMVNNLGDVSISTSATFISGLTVQDEGSTLGLAGSVTGVNFTGPGIAATRVGNLVTINVPQGLTSSDVRNTVGSFVTGTKRVDANTVTETGITVNYDSTNNTLELGVRDFTVGLTGAVTGSATVSRLGNVSIATTTDLIKGLTVEDEGLTLGVPQSVRRVNFTGGGVNVTQNADQIIVNVPTPLGTAEVRSTIGDFVQGTIRDPNTNVSTESGIFVNYDSENEVLEVAPRDFNITLQGAVTGTAKVSRLSNVTINTSSDFIKGVRLQKDGILLGTQIKTINLTGGNAVVNGDTATLSLEANIDNSDVVNAVSQLLVGDHHQGVTAVYDAGNNEIDLVLKPLAINLTGAVSGNGTVTYGSGANPQVTIATTSVELGIQVADEGTTAGTVKSVNFVGGGVTSAVSIDGETATVYIPNSPANENFLLIDNGSANVPNARKLTAGTGIVLNDGGPGGGLTISASSDAIIAKSRFMSNGVLVAERSQINILPSTEIIPEIIDDAGSGQINIRFYGINDGWHRMGTIECGYISDKYGPSIDLGSLQRGIIETDADMGTL